MCRSSALHCCEVDRVLYNNRRLSFFGREGLHCRASQYTIYLQFYLPWIRARLVWLARDPLVFVCVENVIYVAEN